MTDKAVQSETGTSGEGCGGAMSRRGFLGISAAATAITLAPGVTLISPAAAKPADQAASPKVRWGMLVDVTKCADGCDDCVVACAKENGLKSHNRPETDAQWIRKVTLIDKANGFTKTLPVMCQHCAHPPCVDVCPTGASFKRPDGIVLVDKHICIGCRYCMMACPYKARNFVHEDTRGQKPHAPRGKGTVESCTLCVHRVDEGGSPACVEACSKGSGALMFGDIADPNSAISQEIAKYGAARIRADLGLDTGVAYRGL
ncbi:MAG: 4Fe-4S dicluster domain-containing protein [Rhodospirillales bacterium]|nr:4Fe-4S dicluster domain-containing protein [Rhodospirillales bacterium]MCW8862353.1 4Fe-4S dicluster domain-containing protein [Rhodospirillales bacterium]MCW8953177.1 4Fe-4S dicluster domain-containing protein [Rhodospirillales bacterium]MCW8969618.1 4Fe-4S dicluster domain-containing protein [Rhodospirillales bacterium]MCW9001077.1 4Fe-4S dicluster domain-containing protein [Rhodospirillales bacterium]